MLKPLDLSTMLVRSSWKSCVLGFHITRTKNFQMSKLERKGRGIRDQIANIWWIMEKARKNVFPEKHSRKTSTSVSLTTLKPLTVWIITNCGKLFSSVQSLSRVRLFATPRITARQASLSITNSRSSLRLTSIESLMPSSHLILCRPLLLLPPIPLSIRVFSNESTLCMRWPEYWSFSFSIIPSKEIPYTSLKMFMHLYHLLFIYVLRNTAANLMWQTQTVVICVSVSMKHIHTTHVKLIVLCTLTLNELFLELWCEQPKMTDSSTKSVGEG